MAFPFFDLDDVELLLDYLRSFLTFPAFRFPSLEPVLLDTTTFKFCIYFFITHLAIRVFLLHAFRTHDYGRLCTYHATDYLLHSSLLLVYVVVNSPAAGVPGLVPLYIDLWLLHPVAGILAWVLITQTRGYRLDIQQFVDEWGWEVETGFNRIRDELRKLLVVYMRNLGLAWLAERFRGIVEFWMEKQFGFKGDDADSQDEGDEDLVPEGVPEDASWVADSWFERQNTRAARRRARMLRINRW